jgi:hypothetical protein
LQDIKYPTKDSKDETGGGKFISNRSCVHLGWICGLIYQEKIVNASQPKMTEAGRSIRKPMKTQK